MRVIIIGGGWAGTAAAIAARKAGAEVCLIEKTDMLLGCGNAGGIMRNNGRFTAAEEMIALGGGELFQLIDRIALHRNVEFPGHHHATLYPVNTIEAHVRRLVLEMGIDVRCSTHICDVACDNNQLKGVYADSGDLFKGDVPQLKAQRLDLRLRKGAHAFGNVLVRPASFFQLRISLLQQ